MDEKTAQEFAKLLQDPDALARLQKQASLQEFKEKYNVERASPLRCPVCNQFGQSGGSLWINKDDHTKFVCRKCLLEFKVECLTLPNDELIIKIREASKSKEVTR